MIKRRLDLAEDTLEEEPPTLRRPNIDTSTDEVSQVRPVRKLREPKIVPPPNGEEMLRKRQQLVRTRALEREANAEAVRLPFKIKNALSSLQSIEDEINQPGITLSQPLTIEYIQRLTNAREELEELVAKTRKLDATRDLSNELIDMNIGLMHSEDLLHTLHKSLRKSAE